VTAVLAGTRREAILSHLVGHPDLTSSELRRVIGSGSDVAPLLLDMRAKAQVVVRTARRPGQGAQVRLWRIAPEGTVPPPRPPVAAEVLAAKRERDRRATAARRARARVPFAGAASLPDAACAGADPALFFPERGDTETEARAKAICARCPVRAACLARALENGERFGVFGGVNLETAPRRGRRMSVTDRTIEPMTVLNRSAVSLPTASPRAGLVSPVPTSREAFPDEHSHCSTRPRAV
jgi:WhiB family transcriptional regulator, redox-sensing transcriptional regulator